MKANWCNLSTSFHFLVQTQLWINHHPYMVSSCRQCLFNLHSIHLITASSSVNVTKFRAHAPWFASVGEPKVKERFSWRLYDWTKKTFPCRLCDQSETYISLKVYMIGLKNHFLVGYVINLKQVFPCMLCDWKLTIHLRLFRWTKPRKRFLSTDRNNPT